MNRPNFTGQTEQTGHCLSLSIMILSIVILSIMIPQTKFTRVLFINRGAMLPKVVLALVCLVFMVLCVSCAEKEELKNAGSSGDFLSAHWERPLAPQGTDPAALPELLKTLQPAACGECHPAQYNTWLGSRHSRAMGAGLLGQLADMEPTDQREHQACLRCHAPLAEQADGLVNYLSDLALGVPATNFAATPGDSGLELFAHGLICASCHLRGNRVYGPPRNTSLPPWPADSLIPHDGWITQTEFQSSQFCAGCHQFEADGFSINGKLLENTYNEWRSSRYVSAGSTCQSCHMPGRKHLWRGIHDPAMTRQGVEIVTDNLLVSADSVSAVLRLTNSNVGHNFPTYVTPKIYLEGFQINNRGEEISGTRREHIIGWDVTVSLDQENYDTRLAPDESALLQYNEALAPGAEELILRVRVEPDDFYSSFFEAKLDGGFSVRGQNEIELALAESRSSGYIIYFTGYSLRRQ